MSAKSKKRTRAQILQDHANIPRALSPTEAVAFLPLGLRRREELYRLGLVRQLGNARFVMSNDLARRLIELSTRIRRDGTPFTDDQATAQDDNLAGLIELDIDDRYLE